jgi:hypothetical protein
MVTATGNGQHKPKHDPLVCGLEHITQTGLVLYCPACKWDQERARALGERALEEWTRFYFQYKGGKDEAKGYRDPGRNGQAGPHAG